MREKLVKKRTANDKQVPSTSQSKRSKTDEASPTENSEVLAEHVRLLVTQDSVHTGSESGAFWRNIRSVLLEVDARETTPLLKVLPPIQVSQSRTAYPVNEPHTPGYHGDSPIPPPGLPSISDHTKQLCCTTRPPNPTQQLFFKKTDKEKRQARVLNKYQHTHPIHRGMIEAVEEPNTWKMEKKKRVDNAIQRVAKSYVHDPRSYQEPDINERVDSQFMPTRTRCPKPKPTKHSLVILDPEKMIRDRNNMSCDIAPDHPSGNVPESCNSHLAAQIAYSVSGHSSKSTHNIYDRSYSTMQNATAATSVRSGVPLYNQRYGENAAVHYYACAQPDNYDHNMYPVHRPTAPTPMFDQAKACRQEHSNRVYMSKERTEQEYVDELRMEDACPKTTQCDIELDAKRKQMLARKCIDKRRNGAASLKNAELLAANGCGSPFHNAGSASQLFQPAPSQINHTESYSKRRRHLTECQPESVAQHQQIASQPYQPEPPTVRHTDDDSYSKRKQHIIYEHADQPRAPDSNIAGKEARDDEGYTTDTEKTMIPRFTKQTHGPTIRVEPQLTWNASAAKRGLGFKSKLRREQEEAARQNKDPTDKIQASKEIALVTFKLSEEARQRWKKKTIVKKT
ncbi:uncharacterized protein LOC123559595 [Mercenaria mercenaria]|uniref:uncharacterized protein LOC123559595 n=1 Tax=Mercenaria mercenaria TaxID=6596 RepID=UPI00234F0154|nr:uncharacterized protein LOC123559595 [Mercenaria mercenaria]